MRNLEGRTNSVKFGVARFAVALPTTSAPGFELASTGFELVPTMSADAAEAASLA